MMADSTSQTVHCVPSQTFFVCIGMSWRAEPSDSQNSQMTSFRLRSATLEAFADSTSTMQGTGSNSLSDDLKVGGGI